jgi:O-antigen ligase
VGRGSVKLFFLVFPILAAGMLYNQRRMVWVQIICVFVVMYFATPANPIKRKLTRALKWLSPFIAAYVMAGWESKAPIFKPVKTIRSAVDSDVDASTLWRDIENFDLLWTIRQNPIFGTGYGHGFIEMIPLPPVDYMLELYVPHNSILGLWAYTGYVGYTAMTLLWVAGVFFALRAYHFSTAPVEKAAALVSFAAIPIYYLQCYGDMGLGSWSGVFMLAPSLAVAGKQAVAAGAWQASPVRVPKRVPIPPLDPAEPNFAEGAR